MHIYFNINLGKILLQCWNILEYKPHWVVVQTKQTSCTVFHTPKYSKHRCLLSRVGTCKYMQTFVLKEKGILVSTLSAKQVSGVHVGFCYVRGTCGILKYCLSLVGNIWGSCVVPFSYRPFLWTSSLRCLACMRTWTSPRNSRKPSCCLTQCCWPGVVPVVVPVAPLMTSSTLLLEISSARSVGISYLLVFKFIFFS